MVGVVLVRIDDRFFAWSYLCLWGMRRGDVRPSRSRVRGALSGLITSAHSPHKHCSTSRD